MTDISHKPGKRYGADKIIVAQQVLVSLKSPFLK